MAFNPSGLVNPETASPQLTGHCVPCFYCFCWFYCWVVGAIATQNGHPTQDDVEAAYLYNFGRFVEWPLIPSRKALDICVLGQNPFGGTLDRIVSKQRVNGLSLIVVGMKATHAIGSYVILFFGASEASHLDRNLSALNGLPVLTVSDLLGFIDHGGMIQFAMENDSVRLEVNLTAADKTDLIISSQLLKVTTHIIFGKLSEGATR